MAEPRPDLPAMYRNPEVIERLKKPVALQLLLLDVMVLHGNVHLALKHPQNVGYSTRRAWALLDYFETILEAEGIPKPPGGWRALR